MLSKAKHWRGSIYIYYFKKGMCRIPTGITINKRHFSESKLILKSSQHQDYKILNASILSIKQKVDELILGLINEGLEPIGPLVKKRFYDVNFRKIEEREEKSLIEHFTEFCEHKSNTRIKRNSLKGFTSLKNALIDFQNETDRIYLLNDVKSEWLQNFERFLGEERKPGSLTRGLMNDNTIGKRR